MDSQERQPNLSPSLAIDTEPEIDVGQQLSADLALAILGTSRMGRSFRVHYSICESGRDVTVQAESSAEARRTVTEMFPGSVVTGVRSNQVR